MGRWWTLGLAGGVLAIVLAGYQWTQRQSSQQSRAVEVGRSQDSGDSEESSTLQVPGLGLDSGQDLDDASGRASPSTEGMPFGRVVDAQSGRGINGLALYAVRMDEFRGSYRTLATTAEGGHFQGTGDLPPGVFGLRIKKHPLFDVPSGAVELTPPQREGREAILVRLERSTTRPIRAQVVSTFAGAPVPWVELHLTDAHEHDDRVTCDAEGRFTTTELFRAGTFRFRVPESPDYNKRWGRFYWRGEEEVQISLLTGPTMLLETQPADLKSTSELHARLSDHPFPRPAEGGIPPSARVRFKPRLHVRLPRSTPWLRSLGPYYLHLWTADGIWFGSTQVSTVSGIVIEDVVVPMKRRAGLEVQLVGGDWVDQIGRIALRSEAAGTVYSKSPDGDGRAQFLSLEPGLWHWQVQLQRCETLEGSLHLPEGMQELMQLKPLLLPIGGDIEGTVTSESGTFRTARQTPIKVELSGQGLGFSTTVRYEETQHGQVGTFRFEEVPEGHWTLSAQTDRLFTSITPATLNVQSPQSQIALTVLDGDTRLPHFVEFYASGLPFDEAALTLEDATGRSEGFSAWDEPRLELGTFPISADFTWVVTGKGKRPMRGTASAFEGQGSERLLRVDLEPGWGGACLIFEGSRPTPGVEIVIDGETFGPSDEAGQLWLSLPTTPTSIQLAGDRYIFPGGEAAMQELIDQVDWRAQDVEAPVLEVRRK